MKAPIDSSTGRRRVGRPATIDRERIAEAAVRELDGLSVHAIAARLGVVKSALYRHISGREDLVMLAAGRALRDWRRPDTEAPIEEFLLDFARSLEEVLDAHPGLDELLLELHEPPPRTVEHIMWAAQVLTSKGVTSEDAPVVAHVASTFALENARHRRALGASGWPRDWLEERVQLIARGLRRA